jgi:hypothetical protein
MVFCMFLCPVYIQAINIDIVAYGAVEKEKT